MDVWVTSDRQVADCCTERQVGSWEGYFLHVTVKQVKMVWECF